jgi:hypothetical protein
MTMLSSRGGARAAPPPPRRGSRFFEYCTSLGTSKPFSNVAALWKSDARNNGQARIVDP